MHISNEAVTATALREKLRQIRDSDHPASPWARNVMQCMDELQRWPESPELMRALGYAVARFEKAMAANMWPHEPEHLTDAELASIFGFGGHPREH